MHVTLLLWMTFGQFDLQTPQPPRPILLPSDPIPVTQPLPLSGPQPTPALPKGTATPATRTAAPATPLEAVEIGTGVVRQVSSGVSLDSGLGAETGDGNAGARATRGRLLVQQAWSAPRPLHLDGQSLSLVELLQRAGASQRLDAVSSYWILSRSMIEYNLAADELANWNSAAAHRSAEDETLFESLEAAAKSRELESRLDLLMTQHELADRVALSSGGTLPLPADAPFVGAYRTNFAALLAAGAVPVQLQRIDRQLPLLLALIESRAREVELAETGAAAAWERYGQSQLSLGELADATARRRTAWTQFLAAVVQYNQRIAEYALSIGTSMGPAQIAAMLIRSEPAVKSVLVSPREARPASVTEPLVPLDRP